MPVTAREYGQYGGITHALELVGERWTLLIIRDLLIGSRRYGELAEGLPRIPSNVLAARLKELEAAGVVHRAPRSHFVVYQLTDYGLELEPVVRALGVWGFKAMAEPRDEQVISADAMTMDLRTAFHANVAATLPPTTYAAHLGSTDLLVRVDGPMLEVGRGVAGADVAFTSGTGVYRLISGELSPQRAMQSGMVTVLHGSAEVLDRFVRTFRLTE